MAHDWTTCELSHQDDMMWDNFTRAHPLGRSVAPMWEEQAGWVSHRIGLQSGQKLVGGLVLLVRKIPRWPGFLARVPCVMVGPEHHAEMFAALLEEVDRVAKERAILEIEVRLRIPANDAVQGNEHHRDIARVLANLGYRALTKRDRTYFVYIHQNDESLLGSFHGKCRNIIRKAIRAGGTVSRVLEFHQLENFYRFYRNTCARKGIPTPKKEAVVDGMKPLIDRGQAFLYVESHADRISNMAVVDACGVPCYMLGTRAEADLTDAVQGAAQFLHYEIMKDLRSQGKRYYDLGGCEGPVPVKGHPNYGVWHFKYGFRGVFVEFLPYYRKARGLVTRSLLNCAHRLRGDPM